MDEIFRTAVISQTPNPQTTVYYAMHQCYYEGVATDSAPPTESKCGEIVIQHLLKGNRGHYGPLEHPQIVLSCSGFPHSVMQQLRTHRIGVSFDVQSGRYTGLRYCRVADRLIERGYSEGADLCDELTDIVDSVVYLRPVGEYRDRQGARYQYTQAHRDRDLVWVANSLIQYRNRIHEGVSEEHARGLMPFDFRQNFVMSANLRSLMHLLDLRAKKDAQLECQAWAESVLPAFQSWAPEIYEWYRTNRLGRALLAP